MYTAPVPQGVAPQVQQPAAVPPSGAAPVGSTHMPHFAPAAAPNPYQLRDRQARQEYRRDGDDAGDEAEVIDDGSTSLWEFRWFLPRSCGFLAQYLGQAQVIGYRPSRARSIVIALYRRIYGLGLPLPKPPGMAEPLDAEAIAGEVKTIAIDGSIDDGPAAVDTQASKPAAAS